MMKAYKIDGSSEIKQKLNNDNLSIDKNTAQRDGLNIVMGNRLQNSNFGSEMGYDYLEM